MSDKTLLPPNASELERAIEGAIQAQLEVVPIPLPKLWYPDTCPASFLPWLAWALSVDHWNDRWSVDLQRNAIRQSYKIHQQKGTVHGIRFALRINGYGECDIQEGIGAGRYDGTIKYAATHYYGPDESYWAHYRLILKSPTSIYDARQIKQLLVDMQPVRCKLSSLTYSRLSAYNGTLHYDGRYTYGVVDLAEL